MINLTASHRLAKNLTFLSFLFGKHINTKMFFRKTVYPYILLYIICAHSNYINIYITHRLVDKHFFIYVPTEFYYNVCIIYCNKTRFSSKKKVIKTFCHHKKEKTVFVNFGAPLK